MTKSIHELLTEITDLKISDPHSALVIFTALCDKHPADPSVLLNTTGILVEIGTDLNDDQLINRGIQIGLKLLNDDFYDPYKSKLYYDIANGYSSLHNFARLAAQDYRPAIKNDTLSLAKKFYRLFLSNEDVPSASRVQGIVNFANCLSGLGRTYEAIELYYEALHIDSNHPMALANLGIELEYYAQLTSDPYFFSYIFEYLYRAIKHPYFQNGVMEGRALAQCIEVIGRVMQHPEHLQMRLFRNDYLSSWSEVDKQYLIHCLSNRLLINFTFEKELEKSDCKDSIVLPLTSKLKLREKNLLRIVNSLKEDFAIARRLYYEALDNNTDYSSIDKMTLIIALEDDAIFGVKVNKLKVSFASCFNLLDKIAFFINTYLSLDLSGPNINFFKVWYKPSQSRKDTTIFESISQSGNAPLFALFDIAQDFDRSGEFYRLREKRNYLVHRYITVHSTVVHDAYASHEEELYHTTLEELSKDTLTMLKIVKSAIVYLFAFVDLEERKAY